MKKFSLITGELSLNKTGGLSLNKTLDSDTYEFLQRLSTTSRMAVTVDAKYGVDGEFYTGFALHYTPENRAPSTQPDMHCHWKPSADGKYIRWNGNEEFEHPVEWIEYIISKVLAPRGYILNGYINYKYDNSVKASCLTIVDNTVNAKRLITDYRINVLLGAVASAQPLIIDSVVDIYQKKQKKKNPSKKDELIAKLEAKVSRLEAQIEAFQKAYKNLQA